MAIKTNKQLIDSIYVGIFHCGCNNTSCCCRWCSICCRCCCQLVFGPSLIVVKFYAAIFFRLACCTYFGPISFMCVWECFFFVFFFCINISTSLLPAPTHFDPIAHPLCAALNSIFTFFNDAQFFASLIFSDFQLCHWLTRRLNGVFLPLAHFPFSIFHTHFPPTAGASF